MTLNHFHVEELRDKSVEELEIEIVERKGKGHPDSLIDGASEAVSRGLCEYYLQHFDTIFHHNVDKGLLVGGRSEAAFGKGEVKDPIYLVVAGRATAAVRRDGSTETVPVAEIAVSSIKKFIRASMRFLDPDKHVIVDQKIRQGSSDLMAVFEAARGVPLSNDTSIGVGYAPLSPTERLALETERLLNSPRVKEELPEIGEDIKVMALRQGRRIDLTIAAAMIGPLIPDGSHYQAVVEEVKRKVEDQAGRIGDVEVEVHVNSGDNYSRGVYYLTVTGTSAEAGDDGNTGRGNRVNGLITPMRQYSMEATAGKNPVNHTGKIFNVVAERIAAQVHREVLGVREAYVRLLSRIGAPINEPQIASVALKLGRDVSLSRIRGDIEGIVANELAKISEVTPLIVSGAVTLF